MNNFIIQGIGFIAFIFAILSFQNKKRKKILIFVILAQLIFSLHFALLEAWSGFLMNLIASVRTIIFKQRERKRWANHQMWMYFFIILFWVLGIKFLENNYGFLPILAMTIGSIALWKINPQYIRFLMLFPTLLWIIYDIIVGSYPGVLTEFFIFLSITVGILRFKKKKWKN